MKGDFSRLTFDKKKHYSDILMQQGRVLVDADWNEQQAIKTYLLETQAADIIGKSGAPLEDGLRIQPHTSAKAIAAMYDKDTKTVKYWVVGDKGSILFTDGSTMTEQHAPQGMTDNLSAVYFTDANNGWAVGVNGAVIQTPDGGKTWKKQSPQIKTNLLAVYFIYRRRQRMAMVETP